MDNVWNYDPISRGLKHGVVGDGDLDLGNRVWNYDPISRGLKLNERQVSFETPWTMFGTMTRFLGD